MASKLSMAIVNCMTKEELAELLDQMNEAAAKMLEHLYTAVDKICKEEQDGK